MLSTMTGIRPGKIRENMSVLPLRLERGTQSRHTVRIETKEPVLLLLVCHNVDQGGRPLGTIDVLELFEQDLDSLAIGRVHGEQVKALGILHIGRGLISVEGSHG